MRTIWKYELGPITTIELPVGAKILNVRAQNGKVMLWAEVETDESRGREARKFVAYGTGHQLPDDMSSHKYIGTVVGVVGDMVFHIYEVE